MHAQEISHAIQFVFFKLIFVSTKIVRVLEKMLFQKRKKFKNAAYFVDSLKNFNISFKTFKCFKYMNISIKQILICFKKLL